jgi:hypothetical protein
LTDISLINPEENPDVYFSEFPADFDPDSHCRFVAQFFLGRPLGQFVLDPVSRQTITAFSREGKGGFCCR